MSVGHKAMALSKDHKPNRDDERDRIEDAGGQVVWAGTWRVGGVLAVSRSFGNRMMKEVRGWAEAEGMAMLGWAVEMCMCWDMQPAASCWIGRSGGTRARLAGLCATPAAAVPWCWRPLIPAVLALTPHHPPVQFIIPHPEIREDTLTSSEGAACCWGRGPRPGCSSAGNVQRRGQGMWRAGGFDSFVPCAGSRLCAVLGMGWCRARALSFLLWRPSC